MFQNNETAAMIVYADNPNNNDNNNGNNIQVSRGVSIAKISFQECPILKIKY